MPRNRILAVGVVSAVAFASGLALAYADTPPPPPPPPSSGGGGGGGGGGSTTSSPPPPVSISSPTTSHQPAKGRDPAPARVFELRAHNRYAKGILIDWQLPAAKDIDRILVRRVTGTTCTSSVSGGRPIGSTAVRTRQWDTTAVTSVKYCYSVFVIDRGGHVSAPNNTGGVALPDHQPPPAVANVTAEAAGGQVRVSWPAAAGASHYLVMRGAAGACPTTVSVAGAIGRPTAPAFTDATAKPGETYCYAVFPADAAGNVQKTPARSNRVVMTAGTASTPSSTPSTTPSTTPAHRPQAASAAGSDQAFSSELSRMVAAVGAATLVFGFIMLIGMHLQGGGQRRVESWYQPRHRGVVARVALDRYDARALVIPAMLLVGLVVLAAAAAHAL